LPSTPAEEYILSLIEDAAKKFKERDAGAIARLGDLGSHVVSFSDLHTPPIVLAGAIFQFVALALSQGETLRTLKPMLTGKIKEEVERLDEVMERVGGELEKLARSLRKGNLAEAVNACANLVKATYRYVEVLSLIRRTRPTLSEVG